MVVIGLDKTNGANGKTRMDACDKIMAASLIMCVVLLCVVVTGMLICTINCTARKDDVHVDESAYTYGDDLFGWDVGEYVDFVTGVHYIIYGDGERGGITPRLNADGSVMAD